MQMDEISAEDDGLDAEEGLENDANVSVQQLLPHGRRCLELERISTSPKSRVKVNGGELRRGRNGVVEAMVES